MVMETIQIRMSKQLVEKVDKLVETGAYSSRGEVVRDSIRRLPWYEEQIGCLPNTGEDSVEVVRKVRKELSEKLKANNYDFNKL